MNLTTVYLSLGSNIGNREANLKVAIAALPSAGVKVIKVSSVYQTQPVDFLDQAWFLNCVVEAETQLLPLDLLQALRAIETKMGSRKQFPKGPRLIDLDILLYGNAVIETPELQVPHPRLAQRRFVLVPLTEIAPNLRHPRWSGTASELLAATPDNSEVKRVLT